MFSRIFFVNHRIRYPLTSTRLSALSSPAATHPPFFSSHTFSHTTVDTLKRAFWLLFSRMESAKRRREVGNGKHVKNGEHDCWESAGGNDAKASETQETQLSNIPKTSKTKLITSLWDAQSQLDKRWLHVHLFLPIFTNPPIESEPKIIEGLVQLQVLDWILLVISLSFQIWGQNQKNGLGRSDSFAS